MESADLAFTIIACTAIVAFAVCAVASSVADAKMFNKRSDDDASR